MKVGDTIRITFHDHAEDMHTIGTVIALLNDGFVKATIDDPEHPLAIYQDKPRELHVSPTNYQAVK
jgi:hypothetical protein